jgi:hypothetical protein
LVRSRQRHIARTPRSILVLALAGSVLAGCSGGGTSTGSGGSGGHGNGLHGLGATIGTWEEVHGSPTSSGTSYGATVATGAGQKPRYSEVTQSGGLISGWVMAFAAATTLGSAEHAVGQELPPDAQQTASARQTPSTGSGACEVVKFHSARLATVFGQDQNLASGDFTVSYFQVLPNGSVAATYKDVNKAVVGLPSTVPPPNCS